MKTCKKEDLTLKIVKDYLDYKPNGTLTWTEKYKKSIITSRVIVGNNAGYPDSSTKSNRIKFLGQNYRMRQLIWFYHHGYFPEIVVHKNGNTYDDRIENLEAVNKQTHNRISKTSKKYRGYTDVINKNGIKYFVAISKGSDKYNIGYFDTEEDAAKAYDLASVKIYNDDKGLNFPEDYQKYLKKAITYILPPAKPQNAAVVKKLTIADVDEFFYEKDGIVYWKKDRGTVQKAGTQASTPHHRNNVNRVRIYGHSYTESSIVYAIHKKQFPQGNIFHKNRDVKDNRINNLVDIFEGLDVTLP